MHIIENYNSELPRYETDEDNDIIADYRIEEESKINDVSNFVAYQRVSSTATLRINFGGSTNHA